MIPNVPPEVIAGRLRRRILRPPGVNPHLLVLGDSRSGKDFLVRHLILGQAIGLARAIVLDVSPMGDQTWDGWGTDVGPGCQLAELPARLEAPRYRVRIPAGAEGRPVAEAALEQVHASRYIVLVISDAGRITEPPNRGGLGLGGVVSRLMSEGAKDALTVIACSTSAAWAEAGVKDQARTKLLGITSTGEQRRDFAKLAGLDGSQFAYARDAHATLAARQFLYADWADGAPALAITKARAAAV
jgi:hypothetical protein